MVPADTVLESLGPTGAVLPCLPRVLPVPLGVWEGGPGLGSRPLKLRVVRTGSLAFLCPGQQMCVQPVPGLLQEARFQRDGRLPR